MTENCIFCKIIAGTVPTEIIYKDDLVTVIRDRQPAAQVHLLLLPNRHIVSLNRVNEEDEHLLGHLLVIARKMAEQQQISQSGYRVMINTGADAGQTVFHLHVHLMGGQHLPGFTR